MLSYKNLSTIIKLYNKVVTIKKILTIGLKFHFCLKHKIKDLYIYLFLKLLLLFNFLSYFFIIFSIYHLYYGKLRLYNQDKITKCIYNLFFWLILWLIILSNSLFDCISKFAIYYLSYKNKVIVNLIQIYIHTTKFGLVTKKK